VETRTPQQRKSQLKVVAELFYCASSLEELQWVMEDILTPAEIQDVQERWLIVRLLLEGKSQREVSRESGVSISKSRVRPTYFPREQKAFAYFGKTGKSETAFIGDDVVFFGIRGRSRRVRSRLENPATIPNEHCPKLYEYLRTHPLHWEKEIGSPK